MMQRYTNVVVWTMVVSMYMWLLLLVVLQQPHPQLSNEHSHSYVMVSGWTTFTTTTHSHNRRFRPPTPNNNNNNDGPQKQQSSMILYMSSAPSDSASLDDESADFSEQGYTATSTLTDMDDDDDDSFRSSTTTTTNIPTTTTGMIAKLLEMLPTRRLVSNTNLDTDEETRSIMNEMIVRLEKMSPTPQPKWTTSPLLNGVWELRYVGGYTPKTPFNISPTRQLALFLYSGGYSPGVFAYTLAQQLPNPLIDTSDQSVEITISRSQPRITASCPVKLFNGAVDGTVQVTAHLDVLSDVRFRETYESTTILGQESPFPIPKPLRYSRDLYITYLDDDLLIVRDATGVPEILVRPSKQFMKDWGIEPNMVDDMVPPGDGDDANF